MTAVQSTEPLKCWWLKGRWRREVLDERGVGGEVMRTGRCLSSDGSPVCLSPFKLDTTHVWCSSDSSHALPHCHQVSSQFPALWLLNIRFHYCKDNQRPCVLDAHRRSFQRLVDHWCSRRRLFKGVRVHHLISNVLCHHVPANFVTESVKAFGYN